MIFTRQILLCVSLLHQTARGSPPRVGIRNETFVAHQYQLYPENLDVNTHNGFIAFGSLFNSTVDIYDPYRQRTTKIITLPGMTHNPKQHVGGLRWNAPSNQLHILSNAGVAFNTMGKDISGDNMLVKYDLDSSKELWRNNLTELTHGRYGGFQDVALDAQGRAFVIGTYPSSIVRVDANGRNRVAWYGPTSSNYSIQGLTGVATIGNKFLAPDGGSGKLYKFDMRDEKGTATEIKLDHKLLASDGIHLPPIYHNEVLLVTVHPGAQNGVAVVKSRGDRWEEAEYLGFIENKLPNTVVTAAFSLDSHIYMLPGYFADNGLKAGNRSQFPMVDITADVEALVQRSSA